LTENAGFPVAWKRGNYKLRERILTKKQIYDMILKGHTYASIMQELGISERTLYRYIDIIFNQEKDFVKDSLSREELRRQVILARDRLLGNIRRIEEWLEAEPNSKDRNDLINVHSELVAAILRLYNYGPTNLARTLPPDDNNYSTSFEGEPPGQSTDPQEVQSNRRR
jgi:DNA-binding CsgD family transcriptional regulator